ncbi:TetR/AcrR family transcriptional regulator [Gulosibacter sp. 10]|uniref:TetR/AcrR family transcriptional regulator n=1 Tax=Gulosibacter sp. 10 TaxID=1255570 RepID=UPI00097EE695|nr:TetR/AcrR family transcriptional regulator [Gulosibacter sp. 10]SJM49118.1 Transcriptional regulator, TetR family [Gulosibacter sp. 10]
MQRHRSGPVRSEEARRAILEATARQFTEHGYDGFSIQAVAAEAGVGKQTIYRWWNGKPELLTDCLLEGLLWDERMSVRDTGDVDADVCDWLVRITEAVTQPDGADLLRSLFAAASANEAFGHRLHEALNGDEALRHRLEIARRDGELETDAPVDRISEFLIGAVILRALSWQPVDAQTIRELTEYALDRHR